ncbi:MAG: hypothetical protein IKO25_00295 [Clostridia bacterium]|nr:hypothetical protein [Clostridia bacterium]
MNDLLQQIKQMTPKEQAELAAILKEAEEKMKPEPEVIMLGEPLDLRPRDERGVLLTPEQIWDRDHPLERRYYGYSETFHEWGKPQRTKYWTDDEVDAYNKPIEEAWLAAKRKVFPNAQLPPMKTFRTGKRTTYSDQIYYSSER